LNKRNEADIQASPSLCTAVLLHSLLIHHPLQQKSQWCTSHGLCSRALWCSITNMRMWKQTAFVSVVSISSPTANSSQPLVSAKQITVQNKTSKPLLGKAFREYYMWESECIKLAYCK